MTMRESVVRYSQEQYDAMLIGVYQLLSARSCDPPCICGRSAVPFRK